MSIEIRNSLQMIEDTCGDCSRRTSCAFGKPALKILDIASSDIEKAAAISYIWDKRTDLVVKDCPKPEVISGTIALLKKS